VTEQAIAVAIPAIEATGLSKNYGAVRALTDASFTAQPGEIHALVGENGAGKSTLIKALCGVTEPDSGVVRVAGEDVSLRDPEEAARHGIGVVFQELTLLPWLTVAENLLLHREPRGALGLIRRRALADKAAAVLAEYEVSSIDPRSLVVELSLAQRQIIEIVRAVSSKPTVLFLDEPTSSLAEPEVEWLFGMVRTLRDQGPCVVFTSHRWREVTTLADRITVFRNGQQVATRDRLDEQEAVRLMTGRSISEIAHETSPPPETEAVLEVSRLGGGRLQDVSFSLRAGEILALFGMHRTTGEIRVAGRQIRPRSPKDAIRAGLSIGLVPEDRKGEGLFLPMSVRENLTLPIIGKIAAGGLLRSTAERSPVQSIIERMRIRVGDDAQAVATLSGGNQQKVLLGRWLLADSQLLLCYDVTRGVDVATKQDIYQLMLDLAAEGRSILFYSSDTEEVARLAHRVLVLREGKVAAEIAGPGVDPEQIVSAAVVGGEGTTQW
jgi:ribose transport system ATP-binding protein